MRNTITLTTDFGLDDPYVGIMKGVILEINPNASIVDICHTIQPQNIAEAAFLLSTAYPYFPSDTIHVVVVDPGVGTERRGIILKTEYAFFIAPDNGVLSYVLAETSSEFEASDATFPNLSKVKMSPELEAVVISNPRFRRTPVSSTFHGRDIFAPVAAHLSLGVPIQEFGELTSHLLAFPLPKPNFDENSILGDVIHIDRFGNIITNVKIEDLSSENILVEISGHQIEGLSHSYAEGEELLVLIGSSGNLEVAAKNKSAARILRVKVGDQAKIVFPFEKKHNAKRKY